MSDSTLSRLQRDLDVIKASFPDDPPYDRAFLVMNLVTGTGAGVLIVLRSIPGWEPLLSRLLLALAAGAVLASAYWTRRAQNEQQLRPRRWSTAILDLRASIAGAAALLLYMLLVWSIRTSQGSWNFEAWRDVAGAILFGLSTLLVASGGAHSSRRSLIGWGLSLLIAAVALPLVSARTTAWFVLGTSMVAGSLLSSAILWRQLSTWEQRSEGD